MEQPPSTPLTLIARNSPSSSLPSPSASLKADLCIPHAEMSPLGTKRGGSSPQAESRGVAWQGALMGARPPPALKQFCLL